MQLPKLKRRRLAVVSAWGHLLLETGLCLGGRAAGMVWSVCVRVMESVLGWMMGASKGQFNTSDRTLKQR